MKHRSCILLAILLLAGARCANATHADNTTITIGSHTPGVTPFIYQLTLTASNTAVIKSVQFSIRPKAGSVTRPLSGSYSNTYLTERGDLQAETGAILLPIYGLYANAINTITLTYNFTDGSSKQSSTTITTGGFSDSCNHGTPTILQPRTDGTALSYDFMLRRGGCSVSSVIIDTDGEVRWVSPFNTTYTTLSSSTFYHNADYLTRESMLYRMDLDGMITPLHDYSDFKVLNFHYNIDRGKFGLILDADTEEYIESANLEVDASGNVLKTWNIAQIISAAMTAGGMTPASLSISRRSIGFIIIP